MHQQRVIWDSTSTSHNNTSHNNTSFNNTSHNNTSHQNTSHNNTSDEGCRSGDDEGWWLAVMAAWMLHGACFGEAAGARNLAFFRVKCLQPAMKGTSCVCVCVCVCGGCGCDRFNVALVLPWCSATCRCSIGSFEICACRSQCNGCIKVAWCRGCMHNSIVFCSWTLQIVLEWLHQGCDCDLSADFLNFGAGDFPYKIPLKSASKSCFFALAPRYPVLELQFLTSLHVVLLCFAIQYLNIAL